MSEASELAMLLRPESGPWNHARYWCPLDCGWAHEETFGSDTLGIAVPEEPETLTPQQLWGVVDESFVQRLDTQAERIRTEFARHLTEAHTDDEVQPLRVRAAAHAAALADETVRSQIIREMFGADLPTTALPE